MTAQPTAADDPPAEFVIETSVASPPVTELPEPIASETSHPTDLDAAVEPPKDTLAEMQAETPKNVLPFRPPGDAKPPSLTPVENSAFNELARQLSARLENENGNETTQAVTGLDETVVENAASTDAADSGSFTGSRERCSGAAGMAGTLRAAGARRKQARQGAARLAAGRHSDLPARPAALRQSRLPHADRAIRACMRWKMPAASTRSMSSPASPTRPRRRTPARR